MNVASLVAKLVPLLDAPVENSDDIIELLGKGRWLADYEVARFLVAKRTEPLVRELLANPDPRIRRQGVRWVELTFARAPAAKVLRDATKDRSRTVRSAAAKATRALRLDDVALPRSSQFSSSRGYDPTGWQFGLYRNWSKPKRPIPELSALRTRTDVAAALQISPVELRLSFVPALGLATPTSRSRCRKPAAAFASSTRRGRSSSAYNASFCVCSWLPSRPTLRLTDSWLGGPRSPTLRHTSARA